MSIYTSVLENALLPLGDSFLGHHMMARLRSLRQAQWWAPDQVEEERAARLKKLLAVAYTEVPFYRSLFGDVPTPTELKNLPVATKAALRAGYPHLTTRNTGQRCHESCSSGSTGANFCVMEDPETAGRHRACFLLALEWSGYRLGDPHLQIGITPQRGLTKSVKDRFLRCTYLSAFDLSDDALDRGLDHLDRLEIRHVHGYPGSLYYLARRALQTGWNRSLVGIVTWGEDRKSVV